MSDPLDYTIGWITALKVEYVAAQVFLDERHPEPKCRSPGDDNHYTLGRIGDHNVVITVLPTGQYGLTSAALVAADMRSNFPNINVGLLVGIAGGAPNRKNDIRLGDVVVSTPGNGHGGVFQYDFGRSIQDQGLQCTQHLNQPPMILQEAAKQLRAQYSTEGSHLHNAVSAILDKYPRLQKDYGRPTSDQLYLSDVIHTSKDDSTCLEGCGSDPSSMVQRPERCEGDVEPSVHYGLIASANILCRNATLRDQLATEKDVLCFEMEAAGVMTSFPCLVVRGICDYSDSHKNKDWQGYAAMTAAAYTKDLLKCLSQSKRRIPMKIKASLPDKLNAISQAGFDGIELSMPDIISYGELLSGSAPKEDDYDTLADVGKQIKSLTDELGLKIMMLQPFANFEGWKKGTHDKQRQEAFDKAKGWMKIMEAAGITLLQVGSSDSEGISSSFDDLASDLAKLADLLAEKNYSIAYENWCWATHAPTWKDVWQIVQKTNRPNIGLCLDTFQTAGYEWGDPTTNDGLTAASNSDERQKRWEESLKELASTVPADKIYLLQISDAYKMDPPIEDVKDETGARPRSRWSHDYRPLPCNGGYLPVQDMVAAVLKTGFRSWLSVEVFDGLEGENTDMNEYTQEAVESVKKLINFSE
ncbi:xylose isomerase-like protein [Fusarium flagelliforme]|uniref:xylose isomerase-like protein n=1 Tax=Fusarium flagelliforme TaxID=2675880 RepID=UPI001E8D9ABA|nr:xylose isomerase-like protein [Fusarium flagelliforme]KAH7193898.1 xylose isomerase-like protein [Fusarium flagelliforme]